jgi:hypothetical protein
MEPETPALTLSRQATQGLASPPSTLESSLSFDHFLEAISALAAGGLEQTAATFRRGLSSVRPLQTMLPDCDESFPSTFTIVVNGVRIAMSTAEAASLSPAVAEQLSVDACVRTFSISNCHIGMDFISEVFDRRGGLKATAGSDWDCEPGRRSLGLVFRELKNTALEAAFLGAPFGLDAHSLLSVDALDSLLAEVGFWNEGENYLLLRILGLGERYLPLLCHVQWDLLSGDLLSLFCTVEMIKRGRALEGEGEGGGEEREARDGDVVPRESVCCGLADSLSRLFPPFRRPSPPGFKSVIISEFPELLSDLDDKHFELLWRGGRDGFRASDFHKHCDDTGTATLTVIEDTSGNIFGGFTPVEWITRATWIAVPDPSHRTYIFTLKNPHRFGPRKFWPDPKRNPGVVCSHSWWGPSFCDINVTDGPEAPIPSWSDLGFSSYFNDTGMDGTRVFTGSTKFTVKEIEVFQVTD